MKNSITFFSALFCLCYSPLCAQDNWVPLSSEIINKYNLTEKHLKKIQYKTGDEQVELTRKLKSKRSKVSGGKLVVENNQTVHKIIFPVGTPLVAKRVGENMRLGLIGKYKKNRLIYGPGKNTNDQYTLYVLSKEDKSYFVKIKIGCFRRKKYKVESGVGGTILINMTEIINSQKNDEIELGRLIKN